MLSMSNEMFSDINDDESNQSTISDNDNDSVFNNDSISINDNIGEEELQQIITPLQIDFSKEYESNVIDTIGSRRKRQYENIQLAMSNIVKKPRIVSSLRVNTDMVRILCNDKFSDYLRQKLHKKEETICVIIKRLSQYLSHANSTNHTNISVVSSETYIQKLMNAISVPTTITAYLDYCTDEDGYQPCSLTIRLDDIANFIHYVELYESNVPTNFYSARGTIRTYRTSLRKMQTHKDKSTKHPDTIIASRKFPIGGLKELQSLLNSDLNYFNTWCEQSRECFPSQSMYKYLVGFVLASLWVFSPNGRAGAVEVLTLLELKEMLTSLLVGSTKFKSSNKHKIQPLILQDPKAVQIVQYYVDYLRPVSQNLQSFLRYNGAPFTQGTISTYIKSYFQKKGGLNITVNTLRMVQCSEVHLASIDGRVTESARRQFNYIQGHSDRCNSAVYVKVTLHANSDIARDTFAKLGLQSIGAIAPASQSELPVTADERSIDSDADITRDTFSRLGLLQSEPTHEIIGPEYNVMPSTESPEYNVIPSTQSQPILSPSRNATNNDQTQSLLNPTGRFPWPSDYLTSYNDWGTAHSCRSKVSTRIPWDEKEKQCLRNLFYTRHFDHGMDKWKQLLQAVIDDPNARPLFHRNHVADYTRIREGMREKRVRRSSAFE